MSPDVVLLDMRMPGMDGFEVLEHFHADPRLLHLPIIFLTADNDRATLVRAFAAGVVDFVTKPFITQELVGRVRTQVDLGRAREALTRMALERGEAAWFARSDLGGVLTDIRLAAELQLHQPASTPELARLAQAIRGSADAAIALVRIAQARHDAGTASGTGKAMASLVPLKAGHSGS
jgi:CheY-like chemotaxis protein